jgi:hypothetical protein
VVKIAFDRDEAGERGAERLAERLMGRGLEVYRVVFPKGMDANEYAAKVKPATESLGLVLRQARWMGKGEGPAHARASEAPRRGTLRGEEQVSVEEEKSGEAAPRAPPLSRSSGCSAERAGAAWRARARWRWSARTWCFASEIGAGGCAALARRA